jgi:anaerobic magnesium-protoporphyrin IX monomethyl ester cyclase
MARRDAADPLVRTGAETLMSPAPRVLLINPTITGRRHARFPLAILSLSAALDGKYAASMIDGNVDRDFVATAVAASGEPGVHAVGVTVMGGPQLSSAIAVSKAIHALRPTLPIIWGGAFPTVCPDATLQAPYVDYAVRGQGENTFVELLGALGARQHDVLGAIRGVTWRRDGEVVHNKDRVFSAASLSAMLPYDQLQNPRQYLPKTYLGTHTAGYQAALGCRYRCTFCGVASMYRGKMALPPVARLEQDLSFLKGELGVDSIQFYDHNFFDREVDMVPLLEVMAKFELPWWCFARSDALANLSERSWGLVKKSRLRMAYIGAESPSDWLLHDIRKGTRADQTFAAIEQCRSHGVVPELSFMLAPPQDPEGETEKTFEFIRQIKRMHPATEVMIYIYTPLPREENAAGGSRACFHAPQMSGPSRSGAPTGATRMRPGCPRACGSASSISRPYWDAASRRSWISALRAGGKPPCGLSPHGAIATANTITPGSCGYRENSSVIGTRAS